MMDHSVSEATKKSLKAFYLLDMQMRLISVSTVNRLAQKPIKFPVDYKALKRHFSY
ncbi:hypothetical protein EXN66_Car002409 [Channa argus]|uniref:Uncharacterized protein n=1 Tax=Channa argus TaxID=215402 RepID=A0A6G1P916_CHAAH|nr:hypothetical protein EXN66_Car002409 [Channa argus]